MKTYTAAQVREAETPFLQAGVPLMARASAALATETAALLRQQRGDVAGSRVLVLAGAGNNGGDALHAGAMLAAQGAMVTVVPTAADLHEGGAAAAVAAGVTVLPLGEPTDAAALARRSDVILDGILGTGTSAKPALRGHARDVVAAILPVLGEGGTVPLVVAVDLPSGIGPDDGAIPEPTVLRADLTVTFGGCKTGLVREPAARLVGRIVVVDIGITEELERIANRDRD
jgi:NAD(P)H-hydrate epimerase